MQTEFARVQMITQQVRAWDVFDERVLTVMRELPRERFAPERFRDVAYADSPIPLAHGQQMLPASVHGRILQALAITPEDSALEIGSGSGYLTACLGRLASRVRSIEIYPDLAEEARANVLAAAVNNVAVESADGARLDAQMAYDVIAVTGSLPANDERYQRALKMGGRLFVVIGQAPIMEAWKVTRIGEREWQRESLFETVIDPLLNAARPSAFIF
jgi:protein-L-isoaspartate(D-aspartate) O-methyltransferase